MIVEITKINVSNIMPKLFSVTLKLRLIDDDRITELLNQNFSENYRIGQSIVNVVDRFRTVMQKIIDNYKAEQNLFNNAQLDNAIKNLKNSLIV